MSGLKPLWLKLQKHLDQSFKIENFNEGRDRDLNKTKITACNMLWVAASRGGKAGALTQAQSMVDDFSAMAEPDKHSRMYLDMAQEAITYLDAQPE